MNVVFLGSLTCSCGNCSPIVWRVRGPETPSLGKDDGRADTQDHDRICALHAEVLGSVLGFAGGSFIWEAMMTCKSGRKYEYFFFAPSRISHILNFTLKSRLFSSTYSGFGNFSVCYFIPFSPYTPLIHHAHCFCLFFAVLYQSS